ncbi:MAG: prolipoprotein diacylglyceryl transferase [Lachnospiraceae bacterium]|nr:prolipoprotein diacylglyceryl transferase [Lachnospiraceae bacterium]
MDYNINFPHLGIYLSHVGKNISIGGFSIAYYGIVIALGMLLAAFAMTLRARETHQDTDAYMDMFLITIAAGVVGARIYYVVFSWDHYKNDLLSVFNIRQGGLAIYGGILAGVCAIYLFARHKKWDVGQTFDTIAMSVPIGQILGRWGNFFNREAFGGYTDSLFAMQLPVSAVRQNEITEAMWENLLTVRGVSCIQVHPTFLYESLWNTGLLIFLFFFRNKVRFKGELFLLYLTGYGIGRFFIESLRTDQLLLPHTRVPVSMLLSAVLAASGTAYIIRRRLQERRPAEEKKNPVC